MSFDLAILSGVRPLGPDQALRAYELLCESEDNWSSVLQADERIAEFLRVITAQWPQLSRDLPDDELDNCPWSIAFDTSPAHVIICMRYSRTDDVVPVCIDTALRLGLNVFDPQACLLHSPGREPRTATPNTPKERICAHCRRPIPPTESFGTRFPGDDMFHLDCLSTSRVSKQDTA